ncbi:MULTISPECIES: hypothetical protein [unclassified Pseudomonas]|uniref:hypothetical protein n=1 Tax=unclassified Pseudomonas TaxID=196821 RepID=UPI002449B0E1|nr:MULTISPECIES: hypothetical protein [unclassified Pseudomonas]MDG9927459.1 hypothetical protein [Pseudomonas sp. GD04042]MDH0482528.1 hypothetical protein [Pseudomonas sp. GD04015]MDH0602880.1 hypothetical protein [Pseudomonas sp. GD03869]
MPTDLIAALRGEDGDLFVKEAADMLERQQKLLDKDAAVAGHMQSIVDGLRAQLEALRSAAGLAIERAAVFDDGTDGADAESARSVVAILRGALVPQPADATYTVGPFRGDDAALVRNAQALLNLDARGALTPGGTGEHARTIIAAFIERWPAAGAAPAVPEGYALVPVEPTEAMIEQGAESLRCDCNLSRTPQERTARRAVRNVYAEMLTAAPAVQPDSIPPRPPEQPSPRPYDYQRPDRDQLALDAANDITRLVYGAQLAVSCSSQLLAKVQCRILDAINGAQQPVEQQAEFGDAYQGAREDLAIWKRRAQQQEGE